MLIVTVKFVIRSDLVGEFLPKMVENAKKSVTEEPGCHVFEIGFQKEGSEIFLYEIYSDRAAFDLHLTQPHFKQFDHETADMIVEREIRFFDRLFPSQVSADASESEGESVHAN